MKKINFSRIAPEQLTYFDFPYADGWYKKVACQPLDELDNGKVFKKIFFTLLQLIAYGILIYGVILIFSNLLGDRGFIKGIENFETYQIILGGFVSLISIIASIAAILFCYSIINNRSKKLYHLDYDGILPYVFGKLVPILIVIIGEMLAIMLAYMFIGQLLAALSGSPVYNPIADLFETILPVATGLIFIIPYASGIFKSFIPDSGSACFFYGNYEAFSIFIKTAFMFLFSGVIYLIIFYIIAEVYKYLYKLVLVLIQFLPKFAIPVAVRHRDENKTPESKPREKSFRVSPKINIDDL